MKIVVFDMDETLGYFTQLSIFWDSLSNYFKTINKTLSQQDFNNVLDLFPEFLRPNIINILNYLKKKKQCRCCHKMVIYTNNNGSKEWSEYIKKYFEEKINYKLFDQIIAAYKINGKHVEICRTTHDKTHKDLIKCTKLPANSEICFLDDTFYPKKSIELIKKGELYGDLLPLITNPNDLPNSTFYWAKDFKNFKYVTEQFEIKDKNNININYFIVVLSLLFFTIGYMR